MEQAAATEHGNSKRTRSAHAASASEDASAAGVGSRSAKESKEPKKDATSGDSKEGRAKSRRAEKQAENSSAAPSNGAGMIPFLWCNAILYFCIFPSNNVFSCAVSSK